jgi:hypothetical protein
MEANPNMDYISNSDIKQLLGTHKLTTSEWKTRLESTVLDMLDLSEKIEDIAYMMDYNTDKTNADIDMALHKNSLDSIKQLTRDLRTIKNWMDILSKGPTGDTDYADKKEYRYCRKSKKNRKRPRSDTH